MNDIDYDACFEALGIPPDSSWETVRTAYRRAAGKWHPDRFASDPDRQREAEEQFKAISQAHETLAAYYRQHGELPGGRSGDAAATADGDDRPEQEAPFRDQYEPSARARDARSTQSSDDALIRRTILKRSLATAFSLAAGVTLLFVLIGESKKTNGDTASHLDHGHGTQKPVPAVTATASTSRKPANPGAIPRPLNVRPLTYGASLSEVQDILGVPTRTEGDTWFYGDSEVRFRDGRVVDWWISESDPIRTSLSEAPRPTLAQVITKGASKADVLRIQGPPLWKSDSVWQYQVSKIYFDGNRVSGWYSSPLDPLKVER